MKAQFMSSYVMIALALLAGVAQGQDNTPTPSQQASEDTRIVTPAPVNVQATSLAYSTETERSNYLRAGIGFSASYDTNVYSAANGSAVSDESYSVFPSIAIAQTTPRLRWDLSYDPGYTFYQNTSALNQSDQRVNGDFSYRLSPHVTLALADNFTRTSNILNQPTPQAPVSVGGLLESPNPGLVAPIMDMIGNTGSAQISYHFSASDITGASGTFTELRYPNQAEAPGFGGAIGCSSKATLCALFGASARGGEAFYAHRISRRHYFGATYQYQELLTDPSVNNAKVQSAVLFYTLVPRANFSLSFFGGPQHSDVYGTGIVERGMWSPEAGAGLGWQGKQTSVSAALTRRISDGGGLVGPVTSYSATVGVRHQLTRYLTVGAVGSYADSAVLQTLPSFTNSGHTISGSISAQRQWGQHFSTELAYMRLRQDYGGVLASVISPDRNRVWATLFYHFQRPIGR